jgi:hypothetical protein
MTAASTRNLAPRLAGVFLPGPVPRWSSITGQRDPRRAANLVLDIGCPSLNASETIKGGAGNDTIHRSIPGIVIAEAASANVNGIERVGAQANLASSSQRSTLTA